MQISKEPTNECQSTHLVPLVHGGASHASKMNFRRSVWMDEYQTLVSRNALKENGQMCGKGNVFQVFSLFLEAWLSVGMSMWKTTPEGFLRPWSSSFSPSTFGFPFPLLLPPSLRLAPSEFCGAYPIPSRLLAPVPPWWLFATFPVHAATRTVAERSAHTSSSSSLWKKRKTICAHSAWSRLRFAFSVMNVSVTNWMNTWPLFWHPQKPTLLWTCSLIDPFQWHMCFCSRRTLWKSSFRMNICFQISKPFREF